MGVQSARNVVYSSFIRNYKLWEKEFTEYSSGAENQEIINNYIDQLQTNIEKDMHYPLMMNYSRSIFNE